MCTGIILANSKKREMRNGAGWQYCSRYCHFSEFITVKDAKNTIRNSTYEGDHWFHISGQLKLKTFWVQLFTGPHLHKRIRGRNKYDNIVEDKTGLLMLWTKSCRSTAFCIARHCF